MKFVGPLTFVIAVFFLFLYVQTSSPHSSHKPTIGSTRPEISCFRPKIGLNWPENGFSRPVTDHLTNPKIMQQRRFLEGQEARQKILEGERCTVKRHQN